ncbi:MAG: GntR family transcriptional regulator [Candidatus Marinimicrobia bacterium]|nr:GntR family transcriptional regulator [Candidatus Neomarinimicrobiota bacterium]
MNLELNTHTPIYLQIANMIRESVLSGDLKPGDPIPSVRQMCSEYGINPQTILNATQILIRENILEKRRGLGMFITEEARTALLKTESITFTEVDIPGMLIRGKRLGMTANDICALIKTISKKGQ